MDFLLSRPCDACGRMVGGGVYYCAVCRIFSVKANKSEEAKDKLVCEFA